MSDIGLVTKRQLAVRLTGTALAAMSFLLLCWLIADSVDGDTRILAGPVGFFRTQDVTDKIIGSIPIGILLPCIFAVGLWRSTATVILSSLGLVLWIAVGIWIEGSASC
jgi:hypothetical protein